MGHEPWGDPASRRGKRRSFAGRNGDAPGKIRTCDLCLRRAALYPLSYGRGGVKCSRASAPPIRSSASSGDLSPDVAEGTAGDGARHASDRPCRRRRSVARARRLDLEHPEPPVRVTAVVEARDRLLARVTALRERDVGLVETGLGGENRSRRAPCPRQALPPRSAAARARRPERPRVPARPSSRRPRRRSRAFGTPSASPRWRYPWNGLIAISHFAANRALVSVAATVSASSASVISRNASGPSRTTRSGATMRPLGSQEQRRPRLARLQRHDLVRDHPLEEVACLGAAHGHVAASQPDDRRSHRCHDLEV